jgi:hypothetical protein
MGMPGFGFGAANFSVLGNTRLTAPGYRPALTSLRCGFWLRILPAGAGSLFWLAVAVL